VRKTVLSTVVVSGVLLAATASLAASDYYIKFEGVDGESKTRARAETIELQSWSFGASQTGVVSPRDSASGLATGKRQHKPMTVITPEATDARTAAPAAEEIRTVTFAVPEPGNATSAQLARLCASGKHLKSAVLSGPDGRYQMNDVVVSSCAVQGNERKYELKGHVTLMK
jgi:type VI protein secretion system component Hcp